jgi:hypothetical protein
MHQGVAIHNKHDGFADPSEKQFGLPPVKLQKRNEAHMGGYMMISFRPP